MLDGLLVADLETGRAPADAPPVPAGTPAGAPAPPGRAARPRGRRLLRAIVAVAVTLLVVAPVVLAALDLVDVEYRPGLDHAWIELRVHDVGGDETPLVGPYSRIGANHPGPLAFYLLTPVYDLLGSSSTALLSSAAVLNALAVAATAAVAYRRGRLVLLVLTGALTAVLLHGLGTPLLRDSWNPWLAVLPFLLFLLLTWSVAVGDLPMLPAAAFVGSFLVQTHLGYAVLVAYLALWALAALTVSLGRRWRTGDQAERRALGRQLAGWTAVAVGVAALAWLAPIVEQVTGDPGNFTALRDSLEATGGEAVGYDRAGGILARELAAAGPWTGAAGEADGVGEVRPQGLASLAVPAAAFVLALVAAAWARARDALLLQGTVAVAVAAGFLATAAIDGTVHTYLIRWTWPLAAAIWLSVAWSLHRALRPRWQRHAAWVVAPLGVLAIGGLSLATVEAQPAEALPNEVWSRQILGVEQAVFDELVARHDPEPVFVFSGDGTLDSYGVAVGLQLQLEKRGVAIVEPTGDPSRYGETRTDRRRRSKANLIVVSGDAIPLLRQSPELELVTTWNPRTPAEQAELRELDRLHAHDALTAAQQARRAELRALGQRIGVFIDPAP